jgi:hypothetical protein
MPVHRRLAVVDLPGAASWSISTRRTWDLQVLAHRVSTRAGGLRPRRVTGALALACTRVWPSALHDGVGTLVAPGFAAQYSPCVCPCQRFTRTLASARHMTRGHRGWLDLRCETLSFSARCRFIPALSVHPAKAKIGLRTTRADEMWHIDTTVIRLL